MNPFIKAKNAAIEFNKLINQLQQRKNKTTCFILHVRIRKARISLQKALVELGKIAIKTP